MTSAPNYTQTPNVLFDHWLPLLKECELKVLLFIIRKTFGWHKERDAISISQIEIGVGSCAKHVLGAINALITYGLIKKEVVGKPGLQKTFYEMVVIENSNNYPLANCQSNPWQFASPTPGKLPVTKEHVKEDIQIKNDNVSDDRFLDISPSIVFFDPATFILPNGQNLSLQMQRSIAKYSAEEMRNLRSNVVYFQELVAKGKKMQNPEAYLQQCIKKNYARHEVNVEPNRLYAQVMKEEHKLHKMEILKTVVRFKRSDGEVADSISFELPQKSFSDALDHYIQKNKS